MKNKVDQDSMQRKSDINLVHFFSSTLIISRFVMIDRETGDTRETNLEKFTPQFSIVCGEGIVMVYDCLSGSISSHYISFKFIVFLLVVDFKENPSNRGLPMSV